MESAVALRKLNIAEARENFAEVVNDVAERGERTVLTRRGKDVVAIVPMADLHALRSVDLPDVYVCPSSKTYAFTVPMRAIGRKIYGGVE